MENEKTTVPGQVQLKLNFQSDTSQKAILDNGKFNPLYTKWLEIQNLKALHSLAKLVDSVVACEDEG